MSLNNIQDLANQVSFPAVPDTGGALLFAFGGQMFTMDSSGKLWCLTAPRGDILPTDQGLLEWNYDPAAASSTGTTATSGTVFLHRLQVRAPMVITNVWAHLTNVAVTPVANQSAVGLYSSSGALLSGSGDIGSTLTGAVGPISMPLTTPQSVGVGFYWVAFLNNAATAAKLAASANSAANANTNLAAAALRFAVNGTGQTSLPASITPGSNTNTGAVTFWIGVN